MALEKKDIYDLLVQNLSTESKWFIFALSKEKNPLHKENLRDVANEQYKKANQPKNDNLIASRHGLDIHTARLEGAGLVVVQEIGRVRMYSLSEMGQELLSYLLTKQTNQ